MANPFDPNRSLIAIHGEDRMHFLQGILTQDVAKLNDNKIQFAALLSPQGKILHDMFLVAADNHILLDSPICYQDTLLKRLAMYKLRAKVAIEISPQSVGYSLSDGLPDPRHPELPRRIYGSALTPSISSTDYQARTLALGIPDSTRDFAPDEIVALDAGYDLLNAISFTKGCYVGQEVTARMHYKNIARRGFYCLTGDHAPLRLAMLKFADVIAADGQVTVDNQAHRATLPAWMAPKLAQFQSASNNQ